MNLKFYTSYSYLSLLSRFNRSFLPKANTLETLRSQSVLYWLLTRTVYDTKLYAGEGIIFPFKFHVLDVWPFISFLYLIKPSVGARLPLEFYALAIWLSFLIFDSRLLVPLLFYIITLNEVAYNFINILIFLNIIFISERTSSIIFSKIKKYQCDV